jgi:ribonucleoside-diphosphate reductase beta chain
MLLDERVAILPSIYKKADEYWELQNKAHWLHFEISLNADVNDWKFNLTDNEKYVVGHILKGFAQTELFVEDYWGVQVCRWFKHPEIQMMANTFAAFESIHARGYLYLNQTLGLEDFEGFLCEPSTKAKIDRLISTKGKSKKDIARSLAIFSAFNEGVSLFSSFAILLNFSRFNKLKGVGQIVAFSCRDESLHADAGCWLFRTFIEEYPEIWVDEFKADLYEAARVTVKLEDDFIDKAFSKGEIEGINAYDLKQYIRFRTNTKLQDINLKSNWRNLDMEAVNRVVCWFEPLTSGVEMQDFFAGRVTSYSRGVMNFDNVW